MGIHKFDERRQPVVRHLNVAVQQQIVFGINLRQGLVVAIGKAPVFFKEDELHLGVVCTQQLYRVIVRGVVGNNDSSLFARILQDAGQILAQHLRAVPVQDDDGKLHAISDLRFQLSMRCGHD